MTSPRFHRFHSKLEAEPELDPRCPGPPPKALPPATPPHKEPPPSQDPPDRHPEEWRRTWARKVVVESGLLLVALTQLSEHGAEASDGALLDRAEQKTQVLVPGALGSAASLLISRLGPTHWKGIESTFAQTRSPGHTLSKPGLGQGPEASSRVPGFTRIHSHGPGRAEQASPSQPL